jgi:hypothetical protein
MKKLVVFALLAVSSLVHAGEEKKCVVKKGTQVESDYANKGWLVDWALCKEDIKKFDTDKKILDENGIIRRDTKEDDVYQLLLNHDIDLQEICNTQCHTPYEKLICAEIPTDEEEAKTPVKS